MLRKVAAGLALVVGLAAVGCGGGGSHALSKPEFRKQVSAACKQYKQRNQALIAHAGKLTPQNLPGLLSKNVALQGELVKSFDSIDPPTALATRYKEFKSVASERRDLQRQLGAFEKAHPGESSPEMLQTKSADAGHASIRLANVLGVPDCLY